MNVSMTSTLEDFSLEKFPNAIKQELLITELLGETSPQDYLGQSVHLLANHHIKDLAELTKFSHEHTFDFEDADELLKPGYLDMEDGWVRRNDGSLFIACLTDLGQVTGEMFDWWFCQCDDTDKYKWWHPYDHKKCTWDPSYFSSMPFERERGHYVDHIHIVEETIGSELQSLQIEFMRPSKIFDVDRFAASNITACLVARVYVKDPVLGMLGAGHLVHLVREVNGRNELRSRFWIGDDIVYPQTPDNYYMAQIIQGISSLSLFKILKIPYATGKDTYIHCSQEMSCLAHFLPNYYAQRTSELKQFEKQFFS